MNNLQELIQQHKGTRSYRELAEAADGQLDAKHLHKIATNTSAKSFPGASTLDGLAQALNLPINQIILAAAKSAGLNVDPNWGAPDDLTLRQTQAHNDLKEQLFYHQNRAATYKNQLTDLRARAVPRKAK